MKRGAAVLAAGFLLVWSAFAGPVVEGPSTALTGNEQIIFPTHLIGWTPQLNELDVIGDTLHVGTTGWDAQHNGGVGRMIGYTNAGNGNAHFSWAKLYGLLPTDARHVVHSEAAGDGVGGYTLTIPGRVELGYRSGYTNLPYNVTDDNDYHVFHYAPTSGSPWGSYAFIENPFVPGLYNSVVNPNVFVNAHIWPHGCYSAGYIHTVSHEQRVGNSDLMQISYMRWAVNDMTGQLTPATGDGNPVLITSNAMNISADIIANDAGDQVAIGVSMGRFGTIGEDFLGGGQDDQWNNDLWIFQSMDGGLNWDTGTDITQFIGPDYNELPDTTAANGDTMRVYTDCSVVFDDGDNLHAAFTVATFDFIREVVYYESRIYHWMLDGNGNDVWTMINHQPFAGTPEAWGRTTDRPSLYFDDDTGILWCVMEVTDWGAQETDYGSSGITNSDIFVTASPPGPYNGLLWAKPVNVTNTKWLTTPPAPAGSCQSETDPSIALDSDGDNLHMMYVMDLDAGTGISTPGEGQVTDNPVVYHVISKQAMLDEFESVGEWLVNYPMHVDGTGCWVDPGNWAWAEYGGFFTGPREGPVVLELTGINTTIPAGGGTLTYSVHVRNNTGAAYGGVDYWTYAILPNNQQYGPVEMLTFNMAPFMDQTVNRGVGVPALAPPGNYTYIGHIGYFPVSYLQDSFSFTKLGAAGDEYEFDPADWPSRGEFLAGDPTEGEKVTLNLPSEFALQGVYPNPFNAMTTVTVALPDAADLTVTVFNTLGQEVARLVHGQVEAGVHEFTFDASELSSGIYFVHAAISGHSSHVQKVILVR